MLRLISATALSAVLALPAFAESHAAPNPMVGGAEMFATMTIVENALNSADHTTLVAALKAAGLVETLSGEGPFTVFAPTNEAFDALPAGTVDMLLKPENKEKLSKVLTCHVVGAAAMSDMIMGMITDDGGAHPVATLGGCTLSAQMDGEMITLTDEMGRVAQVTIADVMQSNGVIHVIDSVLLPAQKDAMNDAMAKPVMAKMADANVPMVGGAAMFPSMTIVENAVNSEDHTTLIAAVKAAGLVETLNGDGPFTVFAPTNAAFDALPAGLVDKLLQPENKSMLTKVLTAHVVAGRLTASDIATQARNSRDKFYHFNTVSGDALSAKVTTSGAVFVFDENGSAYKISQADVLQSNGVIHVVDGVLVPR